MTHAAIDLTVTNRVAFVDEEHRYFFEDGSVEAVSATTALAITRYLNTSHYTEFGRRRGSLAHLALEYYDRGELDETTLDPALVPYLDAYKAFLAESGATWDAIELRLGDRARGIAGTLDRLGAFGLLDIKTGGREHWHELQTAIYALLAQTNGLILSARRVKRWGLYLTSNGRYDLQPHADPNDLKVAEAVMTIAVDQVSRGLASRTKEAA